jgi:ATP/maltotriose-dependent transcriptional regulator MalT
MDNDTNVANTLGILKLLGNKVNAQIMVMLRGNPLSPRDLSEHLAKDEADIVRRLRVMQKSGLLRSDWGNRLGKNVKLYSLTANAIDIDIQREGIKIQYKKRSTTPKTGTKRHLTSEQIDSTVSRESDKKPEQYIVGRKEELEILHNEKINFIFIVGVAGMGKTSLARKFVAEYITRMQSLSHIAEDAMSKDNNKTDSSHLFFWHTFKEIDTFTYLLGKLAVFLSNNNINDLVEYLDSHQIDSIQDAESLDVLTNALHKLNDFVLVLDDYHKVKDEKILILLNHIHQQYNSEQNKASETKGKVLVLSRFRPPFFVDGLHSKELLLSGLTLKDSIEMMISKFGIGYLVDQRTMKNLWERYQGHPMVIKIFCIFAMSRNDNAHTQILNISSIDSLITYFKREILEILNEDELSVLMTLSVFRTPVRIGGLKGKNKQLHTLRNLSYLLHSLKKRMIVSQTDNQEFFLHDMLKDAVYSLLAYPEDAHASAAQYYLAIDSTEAAIESIYHLSKSHDIKSIFKLLEQEVIDEKYKFIEQGYAEPLLRLLSELENSGDIIRMKNNVRSITTIETDGLIYLLCTAGKALAMLQRWEEAKQKLDESIRLSQKLCNEHLMACSLKNYAEASYLKGDLDSAETNLLHAAQILSRYSTPDRTLQRIYMKLARLYFLKGRYEKSKQYSELVKNNKQIHSGPYP